MTHYEYMTVMQMGSYERNDAMLTELGGQGWRLVHTGHTGRDYFCLERMVRRVVPVLDGIMDAGLP